MRGVLLSIVLAVGAEWVGPNQALLLAAQDAATLSPAELLGTRWLWCPVARNKPLADATLNAVVAEVRQSQVIRSTTVAGGSLLRVDLHDLSPREFTRAAKTWDRLKTFELYEFGGGGEVVTTTATDHVEARPAEGRTIAVGKVPAGYRFRPARTDQGKWLLCEYLGRKAWIALSDTRPAGDTPRLGRWLSDEAVIAGSSLAVATAAAVPIVRLEDFLRQAWASNDDGLYYDFLGVSRDYDEVLKQFGLDRKTIDGLGSDRWAAIFRSGVTDSPRAIVVSPTLGVSASAPGWYWESRDISRDAGDAEDPKKHPLRNLLSGKAVATEAFAPRANGAIVYLLVQFDAAGKGTLANEVPPNIAYDSTVKAPHDQRLIAGRSCVVCHSLGTDDGFRPFTNAAPLLVKSGVDVLADLTDRDGVAKIVDRYQWDSDDAIRGHRATFARFTARAGGVGYTPAKFGADLSGVWHDYVFGDVTPEVAAVELGATATKGKPLPPLARLIPRPAGQVIEDPVIGALLAGLSVTRRDWQLVAGEAIRRRVP